MKKIDPGQLITILANIGVIAGIVFLAVELQQNNALLDAQARATRAQVRINATDVILNNPELIRALVKQQNGESLSQVDQMYLTQQADGLMVRWEYVYGEFQEGLIEEESVPVENWRYVFAAYPDLAKRWEEIGRFSYHPDFVQFMEENVVSER